MDNFLDYTRGFLYIQSIRFASWSGAAKFFDMLDLSNQLVDGKNMGGTQKTFYYALAADVDTWPNLPAAATDLDDANVLEGNFAMLSGKKFFSGYLTLDTGEVVDEDQGEVDGMSYKHIFNLFHPGMKARLLGFMTKTNNTELVFIVPDAEGLYRVVGSEQYPASRQAGEGGTTGKVAADRKGAGLSFYSYGNGPAPIYGGTIPLTAAS